MRPTQTDEKELLHSYMALEENQNWMNILAYLIKLKDFIINLLIDEKDEKKIYIWQGMVRILSSLIDDAENAFEKIKKIETEEKREKEIRKKTGDILEL